MQSEPTQTSQTATGEQIVSSDQTSFSNHGFHDFAPGTSQLSAVDLDGGVAHVAATGGTSSKREASGLSDTADKPSGYSLASVGLHGDVILDSSSGIASSSPGTRESADLITTTSRITPRKGSLIDKIPNELLTHILANLSPDDLAAAASVSRRLHDLVTTPYAWRSAFARYFPGPDALIPIEGQDADSQAVVRAERRVFARLTPRASWRNEYILRSRLLRSLARGKPSQLGAVNGGVSSRIRAVTSELTYTSDLPGSINHLQAAWSTGLNNRSVKLIHGADDIGIASASDPTTGKIERWGQQDPQRFFQFADLNPGDSQYGLGPGEIVGVPNSMDLSQQYGMIYGQGVPGGLVYFRGVEEMRGRFLTSSSTSAAHRLGIPGISLVDQCITSVWIAKSSSIPNLTDGLIGMMSGSSSGVLTAYSIGTLGSSNNRTARFTRGEMTARWVLSPGVPLIAIAVDNEHSLKRQAENRIWAVVLNALGEVFYITKFPRRARIEPAQPADEEFSAWMTARTVYWSLAEASRRVARPDPYNQHEVDGSYSPRSSWNGMCLSPDQILAETTEIEQFAKKRPKDIQRVCVNWDMRRKLEVDFAGDDSHNAGEAVVVFGCGLDDGSSASATRYTRVRVHDKSTASQPSTPSMTMASTPPSESPSVFGGQRVATALAHPSPFSIDGASLDGDDLDRGSTPRPMLEEWRTSKLSFRGLKKLKITTSAMDSSTHALHTQSEDPLLNSAELSAASSPSLGPWSRPESVVNVADVPGQRARFIAIGTSIGSILVWNIRQPTASSADIVNTIEPVRIMFTDSPAIASLAMTSLYLVHGGSDGLVQAWDPLASDLLPIRTLHSRFSSRARRQLIQAQASPFGVGTNMYAAGAICLDPDPTVLRGVVSLGNRLRYWTYSSSAADQYKSSKRRLRRGERGSNQPVDRVGMVTRSNLKDYIASERYELEHEQHERQKRAKHMAGRYGTELLDGSEEELVAYASMLSQEAHAQEVMRRSSDTESVVVSSSESIGAWSSDHTATPAASPKSRSTKTDEELDADIAEAIRQSLQSSSPPVPSYEVSFKTAKMKGRKGSSARMSPAVSPTFAGASRAVDESSDLDFAIQLSLAEEASVKADPHGDEFPRLGGSKGKQRE